jgi:ribonuclease P protein subunit POP4
MRNVLKGEFIGSNIEVVDADNTQLIGKKGRVIGETKNTITIDSGDRKQMLLKHEIRFIIETQGKRVKIDGKKITKRPEKRI